MYTIVETPLFQKLASDIWSSAEQDDFINWIADNPLVGDVMRHTVGLRSAVVASGYGQARRCACGVLKYAG